MRIGIVADALSSPQWMQARPLIERSVNRSDDVTIGDVEAALEAGNAQLWIVDQGMVILAAVTQLLNVKAGRQAFAWQMGGDFARAGEPLVAAFMEWARRQDCASVELNGRIGWRRKLPDWKAVSVTLRKDLK